MRNALTLLAVCYASSIAALATQHTWPEIPRAFLPLIFLLFLPFAYLTVETLFAAEPLLARAGRAAPLAALPATALILTAFIAVLHYPLVAPGLFAAFLGHLVWRRRQIVVPLLVGILAVFLLYATVWNLNHLAGILSFHRLQDEAMLRWDLRIYGWLFDRTYSQHAEGMFPLARSRTLFEVMQAGYVMIFSEVAVVVLVHLRRGWSLAPFLVTTLTAYLVAVAVFVAYPVVGPYHFASDSFDPAFHQSMTYQLMSELNRSYQGIKAGLAAGGYVYVVGLPSLHVAMAMIMQRFLAGSPAHFWAFLPISTLMAVATCYLGHHYLADSLAGALLGGAVLAGERYWRRRTRSAISLDAQSHAHVAARA